MSDFNNITQRVFFRETKTKLKTGPYKLLCFFLFFLPVPIRAFKPDVFLPLTWRRR